MSTAVQLAQHSHASERYAERVNPEWVRLLELLQMNVRYERCVGAELFTADGRCILDFLSGYCVHNVGHNHPHVIRELQRELQQCGPTMIQTHVADLAGELAEKLCQRAGGRLARSFLRVFGKRGRRGCDQVCACSHEACRNSFRGSRISWAHLRCPVADERWILAGWIWPAVATRKVDPIWRSPIT